MKRWELAEMAERYYFNMELDDIKSNEIMGEYRDMIVNIREALRLAGMPETMIIYNTINLPDLKKLLPEDVVKFYNEVKVMTVLYLNDIGFSNSEISRRVGGNSATVVAQILKEYRPKAEVTNSKK